jgi:hypothetical protein
VHHAQNAKPQIGRRKAQREGALIKKMGDYSSFVGNFEEIRVQRHEYEKVS